MDDTLKKYHIGTEENREFLHGITQNLLNFGCHFPSPEGGSYWLGDDGKPWKDRNRETWITARMVHVYSLGTLLGYPGSKEFVDAGIQGLTGELHDVENGGWYASVKADGTPVGPKQCYTHAFVILAASSALLAGRPGAEELLNDAEAIYDRYFWDEKIGLSRDTWNTTFTELDSYRGLNANMHSVEAFLAVADGFGDEKYRVRAGRIIQHVIDWASANNWRIPEHYNDAWKPDLECNKNKPDDQFKPYGATPGHGIEWARLITQWALSAYQNNEMGEVTRAEKYIDVAQKLFQRGVEDGWNSDGEPGIVYTTDWNGKPIVHDRMHWTLAEAINTSASLYQVTGKKIYADYYAQFMSYMDDKVIDHVNGSWFHQLDRNNCILDTVWPGKPDLYHAIQATLIPFYTADMSIAKAVKYKKLI
ncbi:MAG TPA: N-acyl-D-glucosamine 2-epimerase [Oribacterium sp.]|nr:N-acyl-D-glucosamine 2-epimerase [Oribacterium sp.]